MNNIVKILLVGSIAIAISACGTTKQVKSSFNKKLDYKSSRKGKTLEVPPDLSSPGNDNTMSIPSTSGTASYSTYKGSQKNQPVSVDGNSNILRRDSKIRIAGSKGKRWLVISAPPKEVWPSVREFWVQNGFVLAKENAAIGIMETDWAENRANIRTGPIRRVIGKLFNSTYSSGTRDRFRVRLERGAETNTTELFLTHKGLLEHVEGGALSPTGTVWKPRKRDAELEIEVLKRLMLHLGVERKRIIALAATKKVVKTTKPRAHLARSSDGVQLVVDESFSKAWRLVGLALDRTGFTVEDRNRSKGIYYVRFNDPDLDPKKKKGFFSKMNPWKGKKKSKNAATYQILVKESGSATNVTIQNDKGVAENSKTGTRIMSLLHKNLK